MANDTNYDSMLGKIAVEQGLCTESELRRSIEAHKTRQTDSPITLKDILVKSGFITETQAERLKVNLRESKSAVHQIPGYKILGKLGAGVMAVVYKAKQLSLNRDVAIKVLPKKFSENTDYVQRFYKEGQAAASLNHNNIVQAFDVGEAGGYHYFVMEYVEGKTIYEDMAEGKAFTEDEALEIITQVARALGHAHSIGLIHRDVKPKNIMTNTAGVVKLADMGLARATTDIEAAESEAGKAYGTPYYIAPEQIRGEIDIDGRADIYGLGATFYHAVTGRVPFMAENPADVMRMHLKDPLVPPDHINTSLSAGVSEVIEIMMAKRKEDRYSNIDELLGDLDAIKNGQPPLRAHKRFDVSMFEELEAGEDIDNEDYVDKDEIITRYKVAVFILGAVAAVSLLALFFAVVF